MCSNDLISCRYGDFHPVFYMGPLDDAITEAQGPTVRDVSLPTLLLFIHLMKRSIIFWNFGCEKPFHSHQRHTRPACCLL